MDKLLPRLLQQLTIISLVMSLLACFGDGSGPDPVPATPLPELTGMLVNSPVSGVSYQTSPGGKSGLTDAAGEYDYVVRDTVTFSIGGIILGTTQAKRIVSPVELTGSNSPLDPFAANMFAFLQTLDENSPNSADGIEISEATLTALADSFLDFNTDTATFTAAFQAVLDDALLDKTIVDTADALDNFCQDTYLPGGGESGFGYPFPGCEAGVSVELLANGGFELPDASEGDIYCSFEWNCFNEGNFTVETTDSGGTSFAPVSHDAPGAQSLKQFGADSGIRQAVDAIPGATYEASAYAMNWSGEPFTNLGILILTFWDAPGGEPGGGNQIGPGFEVFVDSVDDGTNIYLPVEDGADIGDWTKIGVSAQAPAGAMSAQLLLIHIDTGGGAGSLYWDDASILGPATAPPPTDVELLSNGGFELPDASDGDIYCSEDWNCFNDGIFTVETTDSGGTSFAPVSHDAPGAQSLKQFGADSGIRQAVDVIPGETYEASAYAMNWSGEPFTNLGILILTFWDAPGGEPGGGNQIGPGFEVFVDSVDDGTNIYLPVEDGADIEDWTKIGVSAQAPAGAMSAQLLLIHIDIEGGAGSLYWDDASLIGASSSEEPEIPDGFELVFSDEFNEDGPIQPNALNWTAETGNGPPDNQVGFGNNEWQEYTMNLDNLRVEDGYLWIQARCEAAPCISETADPGNGSITSGKVVTKDKFEFQYGIVRARIKASGGFAAWPAFWMLGFDFPDTPWPNAGEMDIMELFQNNSSPFTTHSTIHFCDDDLSTEPCDFDNGWTFLGGSKTAAERWSDDFHIYELEWTPDLLIFRVDGSEVFTQVIDPDTMEEFRKDYYLILNLAMGGNLGPGGNQPPDPNNTFVHTSQVDWVRVYQEGDGGGGGAEPTMAPEAPTTPADAVASLFSDSFTSATPGIELSTVWDNADVTNVELESNNVSQYSMSLAFELPATEPNPFAGINFDTTPIDGANYTHMALDVWTSDIDTLEVRLVDFGGTGFDPTGDNSEGVKVVDLSASQGEWVRLDIPLSAFDGLAGVSELAQILLKPTVYGTTASLYMDNLYFYNDGGGPGDPAQADLPYTFDVVGVDYSLTDFGGATSSVVADPADAGNMVGQTVKGVAGGAPSETWAGTTMGPDLPLDPLGGFATPIPFAAGATTMSVRVWSPDAGIPVRLKVEDATDVTITVETEALTTQSNAWETLVFDFANEAPGTAALNLANSYTKASIFFNFGTAGTGQTYYWDDVAFGGGGGPGPGDPAQADLPYTFDVVGVDYSLTDFGGATSSVVADPADAGNMVGQTVKGVAGGAPSETWAGTTMGPDLPLDPLGGFATPIPFAAGATTMSVRVWSPDAGIPVRLKVEDATDVTITVETEALTTQSNAWETLVFDFANEAPGTAALNLANSYTKASIFFNFGTAGTGQTYYWDDVAFGGGGGPGPGDPAQADLPYTFDVVGVDYSLTDFGGATSSVVADPADAGNMVGQTVKGVAGGAPSETWAGTTMGPDLPLDPLGGFATPIPFAAGATTMSVRVWSPDAGIPVRLKVEDATDVTITVETEALTTQSNAWETLVFDFANEAPGTAALNLANSYTKASIFFNFGTAGTGQTYYWDDVAFGGGGGPGPGDPAQADLPYTFDVVGVDYSLTDFGGATSSVVADPADAGNMVGQTVKGVAGGAPSETWAGTTMGPDLPLDPLGGFATPIPFAAGATTMSVRVWSPDAGIPVRLKVEDATDVTITVETEALTTQSNAWETLVFDFANEAPGTAALNLANSYTKASIFFNFGTAGTGQTYYWDDVAFGGGGGPGPGDPAQADLPYTFDVVGVDYSLTDFGGATSSVVADPADAGNMVGQTVKGVAGGAPSETWAGTTMGPDLPLDPLGGFATPIPFAAGATTMSVRVWSPDAGIPVRLKVEDATDVTITVETEALTTQSNAWETLVFDFANEAPGTAALNLANSYTKASIFFNFGTAGTGQTYYWDDVAFETAP